MRYLLALLLAGTAFSQTATAPDMTVPKVERKTTQRTVQDEEVIRTCPAGYEGHFVDIQEGFDWRYWNGATALIGPIEFGEHGIPGYTICFSKKFMDEIRKNKDLVAPRPVPPRGA